MASGQRVSLTSKQLSTSDGKHLVDLCIELGLDGDFSDEDLMRLNIFLLSADKDIPAVAHLKALIVDAFADGSITKVERDLLHKQIERILPPTERERLSLARKKKEEAQLTTLRADWESDSFPPSDAQIRYISGLGGDPDKVSSKRDASLLIDTLLHSNESITPRQRMVLRFWGLNPLPDWGKPDVSVWMDSWYAEDPDHLAAWELYKESVGDTGRAQNPEQVPFGIGQEWLQKIKLPDSPSAPRNTIGKGYTLPDTANKSGCLVAFGLFLALLCTSGALMAQLFG